MGVWLWSVSACPYRVKLGHEVHCQAFHVEPSRPEPNSKGHSGDSSVEAAPLAHHPYRHQVSLAASHEEITGAVRATSRAVPTMSNNAQTIAVGPVGIEPTTNRL